MAKRNSEPPNAEAKLRVKVPQNVSITPQVATALKRFLRRFMKGAEELLNEKDMAGILWLLRNHGQAVFDLLIDNKREYTFRIPMTADFARTLEELQAFDELRLKQEDLKEKIQRLQERLQEGRALAMRLEANMNEAEESVERLFREAEEVKEKAKGAVEKIKDTLSELPWREEYIERKLNEVREIEQRYKEKRRKLEEGLAKIKEEVRPIQEEVQRIEKERQETKSVIQKAWEKVKEAGNWLKEKVRGIGDFFRRGPRP